MTDPIELSPAQCVADRDHLVRSVMLSIGIILSAPKLQMVTKSDHDRIIVEAAIGYLLHNGMIRMTPQDRWPEFMEIGLPEYLLPDVDAAIEKLRHFSTAARDSGKRYELNI